MNDDSDSLDHKAIVTGIDEEGAPEVVFIDDEEFGYEPQWVYGDHYVLESRELAPAAAITTAAPPAADSLPEASTLTASSWLEQCNVCGATDWNNSCVCRFV